MRGYGRTSLTFAFVIALAMTGCTLLIASDLDGASSGGVDAASAVADARGEDAPSAEANAGDAGGPEASTSRYCSTLAPAPKFCEDFDRSPLSREWSLDEEAGKSEVVPEQFVSGPNALKVTLDTADACKYSRVERRFASLSGNKRFSLTTRLRLARPWGDGQIPLVIGMSRRGGAYCDALFYVFADADGTTNGSAINVQSNVNPNHLEPLDGYPSVDEWSEMTVVATRPDGGGTRFTVTLRDPNGFSLTSVRDFAECTEWDEAGIYLGFHCESGRGAAYYDDVRVDWD